MLTKLLLGFAVTLKLRLTRAIATVVHSKQDACMEHNIDAYMKNTL